MTTGVVWSSLRSSRTSEYLDKPVPTTTIGAWSDRKSTRLNSSHVRISYAVFCLKKKNLPAAFVVEIEADALRLIGKERAARQFGALAEQTLSRFPALREWLARRPFTALEPAE